jgi:diguanylate cyclase (GGDEF)-like protein
MTLEATLGRLGLSSAAASVADAERVNARWIQSIAAPLVSRRVHDPNEVERQGKRLVDRYREDTARVDQDLAERFRQLERASDTDLTRLSFLILSTALLLVAAALEFWVLQRRAIDSLARERRQGEEAGVRARDVQTGYEAEKRKAETLHEASSQKQRMHAEAQLHHAAYHDALTGLPNRAFFLDRLTKSIVDLKLKPAALVAVLFLDIDRFKIINDSLGHAAGDRLLAALARRIAGCLRPCDMLARLGSDEFSILLEDETDVRDARVVAGRILLALAETFRIDEQEVLATVSIGIAVGEARSEGALGMLRDADIAMFRAKQMGGGRYELFAREMYAQAMARSQLEMDLRRALTRGELTIAYQPIASLATGRITGFEALARWRHPERGMIPPIEFIPLAEETGLIVPLGAWVLAEACREARTWQGLQSGGAPVSVNVNVSTRQLLGDGFADHGFGAEVTRVLAETGLDPAYLNLEITESALLDYAKATEAALGYVRSLGVAMQLDDFGTGYSSLAYLQRLPIDTVKIDLSFISGRPGAGISNPQIVQAIVALAQKLEKRVTAEGVETLEQLHQLQALRCTSAQGYYVSRPLDADGARAFLSHWRPFPGSDLRLVSGSKV